MPSLWHARNHHHLWVLGALSQATSSSTLEPRPFCKIFQAWATASRQSAVTHTKTRVDNQHCHELPDPLSDATCLRVPTDSTAKGKLNMARRPQQGALYPQGTWAAEGFSRNFQTGRESQSDSGWACSESHGWAHTIGSFDFSSPLK